MKKRMFCLALVFMLLGSWAYAEETFIMAGYDSTQYRDWETNLFFQRMEEWTGVHFSFRQYKDEKEWQNAKNTMEKGDQLPDVLFKALLNTAESEKLYEKGVLVDLKPYLPEHCPNLWAMLQEDPELMDAITLPGGQIVALPYIKGTGTQNYMWVNTTWLKRVGMEMPQSREELENVLRAFKNNDPNRNAKADEVPLSFLGPFDLKFLGHAYGLIANDYNIFVEDGRVKFMPLEENFRPFLEWCAALYQEGLLDPDGFSTSSLVRSQLASQKEGEARHGIFFAPLAFDVYQNKQSQEYCIMAPIAYEGTQAYRSFSGRAVKGTFAVTTGCSDVEKMLAWVDLMYTSEGFRLTSLGKENVDFYFNADGTWTVTEATKANPFYTQATLMTDGGTAPGAEDTAFEKLCENPEEMRVLTEQEAFCQYLKTPFPFIGLTEEEANTVAPMQNELGAYVDTMMGRFIRGDVALNDENYSDFIRQLYEDYNVEGFLAFWQQIYDAH